MNILLLITNYFFFINNDNLISVNWFRIDLIFIYSILLQNDTPNVLNLALMTNLKYDVTYQCVTDGTGKLHDAASAFAVVQQTSVPHTKNLWDSSLCNRDAWEKRTTENDLGRLLTQETNIYIFLLWQAFESVFKRWFLQILSF